jgi:hypothetical protein
MVVVMAVMVAELHLFPTLSGNIACCQLISAICMRIESSALIETDIATPIACGQRSSEPPRIAPIAATHAGD